MRLNKLAGLVTTVCVLMIGARIAVADTIHVPADYPTIQAAIDAAVDGDEVIIAAGLYVETVDLLGKAIVVRRRGWALTTTIRPPAEGEVAVRCTSGEGPATVLRGLTMTGAETYDGRAGGLRIDGSPTIVECRIIGNTSQRGDGGGVHVSSGQPVFRECEISDNSAGVPGDGGGMYIASGQVTLIGCTFSGNECSGFQDSPCCCEFRAGGAIHGPTFVHAVTAIGCRFLLNRARSCADGGALWGSGSLFNCTFFGNTAFGGTSDAFSDGWQAVNSIIWDSVSGGVIRYSCVQGGYPGEGNIASNPLMTADGRLLPGSPCIDAGANNGVPADTLDLDDDGNTAERIPLDLDGNPRFNADELDFDPGCGVPVVVDMGAYEYQFDPVEEILVADVDGDGVVAFTDLLAVLAAWGECDADCCLADVDFSWEVGFGDLLLVLANWT